MDRNVLLLGEEVLFLFLEGKYLKICSDEMNRETEPFAGSAEALKSVL